MSVKILTFFNNKGGVGKTSLLYHMAWIMSEMDRSVLACDLDPQANLTNVFLQDDQSEDLYEKGEDSKPNTIFRCLRPLTEGTGDHESPILHSVSKNLWLLPGDPLLGGFEQFLSDEWPRATDKNTMVRAMQVLSAFWRIAQKGAETVGADVILVDVGPNFGAINRSALIASDFIVTPLEADIFSLRGMKNLGPTVRGWQEQWEIRRKSWDGRYPIPDEKRMKPIGYIVTQSGIYGGKVAKSFQRWIDRVPGAYRGSVLGEETKSPSGIKPDTDEHCIGTVKNHHSLMPMAHNARKPVFKLDYADGARGTHLTEAQKTHPLYQKLAKRILEKMGE